jgi:AcrR family transcriptional regulator
MPGPNASRGAYHHGDLRNALERAALELVTEHGPQGFTLAEASRRAGVSVAAPFRHFENRDALLAALALRGYDAQRERFATAIAQSTDPVEQLARFAAAYVQFSVEERALFDVTFSAGLLKARHPELEEAGRHLLDVLRAPAEQLRPDPGAAIELLQTVGATAHGFAAFLRQGVLGDADTALETAKQRASAATRLLARAAPEPKAGSRRPRAPAHRPADLR